MIICSASGLSRTNDHTNHDHTEQAAYDLACHISPYRTHPQRACHGAEQARTSSDEGNRLGHQSERCLHGDHHLKPTSPNV